jgi:hypothetical protein
MVDLVDLIQVKDRLRIDHDDDDADLALSIAAASRVILTYLKPTGSSSFIGSDGQVVPDGVPEEVQIAVIMLVGYWYRNPDGDPDGEFERGYLPKPVTALLYPLRDPTCA